MACEFACAVTMRSSNGREHPDPLAMTFAPCVTERSRRLTGPLTVKSAPVGVISNAGGLA